MQQQATEAPKADGLYRPVFHGDREAWVCQRIFSEENGAGETVVRAQIHGARMQAPGEEPRFSPLYLFHEADAQAQCDMLNGAQAFTPKGNENG